MTEAAEKKKRRTFRKYTYRGVDLDQLLDMTRCANFKVKQKSQALQIYLYVGHLNWLCQSLAQMGHQLLKLHDSPVRDMTQPLATLSHSGLYRCATLIIRGDSKSLEINHGYNLIVMYLFHTKGTTGFHSTWKTLKDSSTPHHHHPSLPVKTLPSGIQCNVHYCLFTLIS